MIFPALVSAQELHRLSGFVQISGSPLIAYFVQFQVTKTAVKGYSLTTYKNEKPLRANLVGKLDPASELYIEEIPSPGSPLNDYGTCYFTAHLKLSVMTGGRQRWNGIFRGKNENGLPCGEGTMTLVDEAMPEALDPHKTEMVKKPLPVRKVVPRDSVKRAPKAVMTVVTRDSIRPEPKVVKVIPKDTMKPIEKPNQVTIVNRPQPKAMEMGTTKDSNACMRTYQFASDSLSFEVWDGWTVDGDVISISINGNMLMEHTKLNENLMHYALKLRPGLTTMMIYLHEEGFDPPNTPNLIIHDGKTRYELGISGNNGDKVRICIQRPG